MKRNALLSLASVCLFALVGYAADLSSISFKITKQHFESGDEIVISEVLATSAQLAIGDTVIVRGRYELHSKPQAKLGFFLTTRERSDPTPISPEQMQSIEEGAGTFELKHIMPAEGDLYVSFYPRRSGSSFGEVYFASKSQ